MEDNSIDCLNIALTSPQIPTAEESFIQLVSIDKSVVCPSVGGFVHPTYSDFNQIYYGDLN